MYRYELQMLEAKLKAVLSMKQQCRQIWAGSMV